jgi:hypothetical protein
MADLQNFSLSIESVNVFSPNTDPVPLDLAVPYNAHRLFLRPEAIGNILALHVFDAPIPNRTVSVDGRPEIVPGVPVGPQPFTTAIIDVTYKNVMGRAVIPNIAYDGGDFVFNLRFNARLRKAAVYITEVPPGVLSTPASTAITEPYPVEASARSSTPETAERALDSPDDDQETTGRLSSESEASGKSEATDKDELAVDSDTATAQIDTPLFFIAIDDGGPKNDGRPSQMPYRVIFLHNRLDIPIEQVGKGGAPLIFPMDGGSEAGPMGLQIG